MRHPVLTLLTGVAAGTMSIAAGAQDSPVEGSPNASAGPAPSRSNTYDAAFFAPYAPRTALDIVRRIPGFTLDLGNTDLRGFSGAASASFRCRPTTTSAARSIAASR